MKNVVLFICFNLITGIVAKAQNTWKGTVNNSWQDARNWSLGHVPTYSEDVVIPAGYINYPVINQNVDIGSLDISGRLDLLNGQYLAIRKTTLTTHPGTELHTTNSPFVSTKYPPTIGIYNESDNAQLTSSLQHVTVWGDIIIAMFDGILNEGNNVYNSSAVFFDASFSTVGNTLLLGNAGPSRYNGDLIVSGSPLSTCSVRNSSISGNFTVQISGAKKIELIGDANTLTAGGTIELYLDNSYIGGSNAIVNIANLSNGATTSLKNIYLGINLASVSLTGNKLNVHRADIAGGRGGTTNLLYNNTFNADTINIEDNSFVTGDWMLQGNTFNSNFNFTKNGSGRAYAYGNIFNSPLTITQNGNGDFTTSGNTVSGAAAIKMLGNGRFSNPGEYDPNNYGPDQFAGDLTLTTSNTGRIGLNGPGIGGNLKLYGNNTGVDNIAFNGNSDSHLYSDQGPVTLSALTLAKTSETGKLILDVPVNIFSPGGFLVPLAKVNFTKGKIISSKTAPFTFMGRYIIPPAASAASHVSGPVTKTGEPYIDNTTSFTFPVGSGTKYYPLTISGEQIAAGDQFTAEYISQNPTAAGYDATKMAATLKGVATNGYWLLSRDAGTTNVTATFQFNVRPGSVTDLSKLRVAHWNGSLWEDLGNGGATWIDSSKGIGTLKTGTPITSFSPFAIATTDAAANVLPVTFTTLSAIYKNGNIEINWATASETNCSHYDIEVSADGKAFTKVGTAASKSANGNSETTIAYRFSFAPSAVTLSALVLLPFLFAFSKRNRWLLILTWLAVAGMALGFTACRKQSEALATATPHLFIRIAQVDMDGGVHYSKIINVGAQ